MDIAGHEARLPHSGTAQKADLFLNHLVAVSHQYSKGGKHHSHAIPPELREKLEAAKAVSKSEFVVTSIKGMFLQYGLYLRALKEYCKELGLPKIGTHGLRHSTSELYMHHGATRDDLRSLFAHSSTSVTDRYIHNRGTNLEKVATVIKLFEKPTRSTDQMTTSATAH